MVTATTPTFTPTTRHAFGERAQTTTLSIATVARPVTTGSLLRRGSFYAAWLPIGGLSLVGLGIGAGRKRRRWLVGVVLGLIAGAILLQSGCGSVQQQHYPHRRHAGWNLHRHHHRLCRNGSGAHLYGDIDRELDRRLETVH